MVETADKIAVLGAGAWGTALARLLAERGPVGLWTWQEAHARALASDRENREFLAGYSLSPLVTPTSQLSDALLGAKLVVVAVPSEAVRATLSQARAHLLPEASLVIVAKGIEPTSLMLLSEVTRDVLGGAAEHQAVFLSGPSFALEVARGLPTNLVAAGRDPERSRLVQQRFASDRLRVYSSDDPAGVQVGGALKNVIAIAAGASDGLGFGHNTRAALITRGLAEMARLAVAKGGNVLTLSGLAGLGDLVLTCSAELSRNRTVGFELGRGRQLPEVLSGLGHVAEGVVTAQSAYHLAERLGVDLPITSEVHAVLYSGKPVAQAVRDLLSRPLRKEAE
ncbi:MAG: glycerol-3-phosphate dehydrogenase [Polyangiaceae bacterium]|nr:glycerol-3-phosphate dehydrogenase [Polyangiaceae bacterium]